jgi:hypothetical protein
MKQLNCWSESADTTWYNDSQTEFTIIYEFLKIKCKNKLTNFIYLI